MDFAWSEQQQAAYEASAAFAGGLNAGLEQRDAEARFAPDLWRQCSDFGVLGWCMPEALGGSGLDMLSTIRSLEGLGYGCRDNALTLGLNGQIWSVQIPLLAFGTEAQKQRYVPALCAGDLIAAHGMTEAETGSDAYRMQTRAEKVDGGYLLNGEKNYIGLASVAGLSLVFALTDPAAGRWGISAFLVQSDFEGYSASQPCPKMGLRTNPLGDIRLENCFVPEENRLGDEGMGANIFNHTMDWERSFIFASHVGAMARQLDEVTKYAREREQFGQPIGRYQAVSHRVAEMKLRLETSRLLLYRAAWLKDQDANSMLDAALTKLHLGESFAANSTDAMRIFGARGYMIGLDVERDLRDAVGGVIYSGTSDIQRNIIAGWLGL